MTEKTGCLLCGEPLEYLETAESMECSICGREFQSTVRCRNGHYVCDECHASPAYAVIRHVCLHTSSTNPIEIADLIMQSPAIHMHGPEHHVLVGSALLAAYANAGGTIDRARALDMIQARGSKIPGGFCGYAGSCGAALSAGIFLSVALGTTPLSDENWARGMRLTAACLSAIAELGGPRCCKRDTFVAMQTTAAFLERELSVHLDIPERIACTFSALNHECLQDRCPFHP
ncbi:MAG TPA: DUF5714 domain-containing protein [Methanocorpusculum sp.]|nr:DUF5714 domain-containing protein [Methanocorpusculum sp.]